MTAHVAVVTGSSSGIGAAVARAFAATGAGVVVNSSRSVAEGEAVAADLPDACYVQADIADPEGVQRLVEAALERWGRIDTLVNNAGTTALIPHRDVEAASVDVWRRIFEVNVFATWSLTVAALPALTEAKGSVVNVSSLAGLRPTGSSIPYAASKAALNHMTVLLAKVVGPDVRVNAVAPGLVRTAMTARHYLLPDGSVDQAARAAAEKPLRRMSPLGLIGDPEDIAYAIHYLVSDAARFVTGQILRPNGGVAMPW